MCYISPHTPPAPVPRPSQHSVGRAGGDSLTGLPPCSRSQSTGAWLDEGERLCAWYRQDVSATHVLFTSCIGWRHILKSLLDLMLKIPLSQERITQQQLSWRQEMRVYFHIDLFLSEDISGTAGSLGHAPGRSTVW